MAEEFGLWAHCPKGAEVAWGARAILHQAKIDLVWDRQSWRGDNGPGKVAFVKVLETAIEEARREAQRLYYATGELCPDQAQLLVLYDGPGVKILGNTNASYGYLYLIAFPHEAKRQTVPVSLSELPPKRCGKNYLIYDAEPKPKNAKFCVRDFDTIRYFSKKLSADQHVWRLNRNRYNERHVHVEEIR